MQTPVWRTENPHNLCNEKHDLENVGNRCRPIHLLGPHTTGVSSSRVLHAFACGRQQETDKQNGAAACRHTSLGFVFVEMSSGYLGGSIDNREPFVYQACVVSITQRQLLLESNTFIDIQMNIFISTMNVNNIRTPCNLLHLTATPCSRMLLLPPNKCTNSKLTLRAHMLYALTLFARW